MNKIPSNLVMTQGCKYNIFSRQTYTGILLLQCQIKQTASTDVNGDRVAKNAFTRSVTAHHVPRDVFIVLSKDGTKSTSWS